MVLSDVSRWYAATTMAVGERTGLLTPLLDGGGTAAELASRAGVDRRNAEVWGDAMVAAGYARLDGERYLPDESALGVLRGGFPFDLRAVVGLLAPLGGMLPRVERAIRDGAGISSTEIQADLGALPEQVNGPMYQTFLLDDWIAAHPPIEAALRSGIDAGEVGPGGGQALRILAAAFPRSRFVGYDLDPNQVERANASAAEAGLPNLRFEALDAATLPKASFDLVCAFDTFHHFGRPDAVLDSIRGALRAGGAFLVAEAAVSGNPMTDASDPFGIIVYGSSLLYCFQESKADGGAGLGATWAPQHLETLLAEHGFEVAETHASDAGYMVSRAIPAASASSSDISAR
jgi:Methylase involved in ubiquinone/menaquinone biosynthesis